jgi:5-(carboxyamino)imidazole ribonucleotide synthase
MIGILGGGQLGRMLSLAAARLGMRTHIYCPDHNSPAFEVTPHKTIAAYEDKPSLFAFAREVGVVTYEFENVPAETARLLEARSTLHPGANALAVAQDRLEEKAFLEKLGIPVAAYRPVRSLSDLYEALAELGAPAVLKTTRMGYDGKGQRIIRSLAEADDAFESLSPKPLVLEAFIPFEKEISVVVARNALGEVRAFDAAENVHRHHILKSSTVPADIPPGLAAAAGKMAGAIATALGYIGVLGVEFFVQKSGRRASLLVNEIAPRVHNSGHWTEAVCVTDQFEQHIRAICGWPLGDPTRLADVVMENLVGEEVLAIPAMLGRNLRPQLYGKNEVRAGRKMGHVNRVRPRKPIKS